MLDRFYVRGKGLRTAWLLSLTLGVTGCHSADVPVTRADVASATSEGIVNGVTEGQGSIGPTYQQVSGSTPTTGSEQVAPPPPGDMVLLFQSEWSTAIGQSSSATLDRDKDVPWDIEGGGAGDVGVVTAAGILGWPTANALAVNGTDGGDGGVASRAVMITGGHWSLPGVGETIGYRWYMNVPSEACVASGPSDHPIHDGNRGTPSDNDWTIYTHFHNGSWEFEIGTFAGPWPNHRWMGSQRLLCDATYRIELRFTIRRGGNYSVDAAVYNAAGSLILDNGDFGNINDSGTLEGYQQRKSFPLRGNDWDLCRVGTDAINGSDATLAGWPTRYPIVLHHYGAVAIVKNGNWPIGPYTDW